MKQFRKNRFKYICHHHVSHHRLLLAWSIPPPLPHAVARAAAVNREHDEWSASPQLVNNIFLHQQESYSSMIDDVLFNTLISIDLKI